MAAANFRLPTMRSTAKSLRELFECARDGADRILILRTLESSLRLDYSLGHTKHFHP